MLGTNTVKSGVVSTASVRLAAMIAPTAEVRFRATAELETLTGGAKNELMM